MCIYEVIRIIDELGQNVSEYEILQIILPNFQVAMTTVIFVPVGVLEVINIFSDRL